MEYNLFSSDFSHLEEAEQGVIEALQIGADTIEELAKGSTASQDTLENHCKSFLERIKAVQQTLVAVGATNLSNKPYQARAYTSHIETSLLQQQIDLATEHLQAAQILQAPNNQESPEATHQC
ncbi:hypothetical protein WJX77_002911 [Trebouxia sp. C0004]